MNTLVTLNDNNEPVTTSLKVAESFGKAHKHVLESIRSVIKTLEDQDIEAGSNFRPGSYLDSNNQKRSMTEMNRKGFMLLVMSFNGERAAKFKNDFVDAFDAILIQSGVLKILSKPLRTKGLRQGRTFDHPLM